MRRPWFQCQPADESFFEIAPVRLRAEFAVGRPASEVWAELTGERPLAWCRILKEVSWTSPRPFGVGATRTARLVDGVNVLEERFFRWEEGSRHSFFVVRASVPLFRRFAEDYLVQPTSEQSCRFTWTIAIEPNTIGRITNPANRLLLGTLFRDTRKHFSPR